MLNLMLLKLLRFVLHFSKDNNENNNNDNNKYSPAQLLFSSFIYKTPPYILAASKPSPVRTVSQEVVYNMYKIYIT